jgi:hypothetical protein
MRSVLRVDGEELQVGDHPLELRASVGSAWSRSTPRRKRAAVGHVQRHRDAGAVAEARLLVPELLDAGARCRSRGPR